MSALDDDNGVRYSVVTLQVKPEASLDGRDGFGAVFQAEQCRRIAADRDVLQGANTTYCTHSSLVKLHTSFAKAPGRAFPEPLASADYETEVLDRICHLSGGRHRQ
jgi:hypothetical protein